MDSSNSLYTGAWMRLSVCFTQLPAVEFNISRKLIRMQGRENNWSHGDGLESAHVFRIAH